MKPPIDSIRLTQTDRDRLIRIKRATGIESWNVLCRWALVIGLKESKSSMHESEETRNGIEIKWDTFAGADSRLYTCLIEWCFRKADHTHRQSIGYFVLSCISHGILVLSKQGALPNISAMAHLALR